MNILVTGANGQVGQSLQLLAKEYSDWTFFFTDQLELDICKEQAVQDFFAEHDLDYCINAAAYTAVDQAEEAEAQAHLVNATAVRYLAKACQEQDCRLVHLSTDYVYHNNQNTPFKESDPTHPQGVYAATKLAGDKEALAQNKETIVIRTSWVYAPFGKNFLKTMLRLGQERAALSVIFDQIGSPTYALDLAKAMLLIIEQKPTSFHGVYHYSNEGVCSWYDFAKAIFDLAAIDCHVTPIETKDYPTPAKRPPFSLLNKAKIKQDFELTIPYWRDSVAACLEALEQKKA